MLGIACRLHDDHTADDLGLVNAPPPPVEPGDLMATADKIFRVVSVVTSPPGLGCGSPRDGQTSAAGRCVELGVDGRFGRTGVPAGGNRGVSAFSSQPASALSIEERELEAG